jgi:hypothetical protein
MTTSGSAVVQRTRVPAGAGPPEVSPPSSSVGRLHEPVLLVAGHGLEGATALARTRRAERLVRFVQSHEAPPSRPAPEVAAHVHDNAVEPGTHLPRLVVAAEVPEQAKERLLSGVLRPLETAEQAEGGAEHHPLVPLDERGEGALVSLAGEADQLGRRAVGPDG